MDGLGWAAEDTDGGMESSPREHPSYPFQTVDRPGAPGSCHPGAAVHMLGMHVTKPRQPEHVLSS